ncbi:RICIN domain-containing protein [Xanthomonadaceae bacterium JHOS43]|nr:RICIN domain-containing protein [Xanthomonadaceae bacterium JHOS43]
MILSVGMLRVSKRGWFRLRGSLFPHRQLEMQMTPTLKQGGLLASLATACALMWSGHAQANNCVVDLALAQGKDNWHYHGNASTRQIGYWDVDNGGAETQGTPLGEHYINLSALVGPMSTQDCIEDIKLTAGDWGQQRNPPIGYSEIGWWDVDDGGSLDSDNRSTNHRMTLFVKKMARTESPPKTLTVIQDIGMTISNDKPSFRAGSVHPKYGKFTQLGWWDVDRDTGCGFVGNDRSCGTYGAVLLASKTSFVNIEEIQAVTYTGRWELLNACRGANCSETRYELTVGAEQGKEISRSSTFGKSLSLMLGTEVKAGGKAGVPFVAEGTTEVTAKVELTGQISSEQQDAIMNSFTISRQSTTAVSCSGASDMWQWKSTLRIQRATRVEDIDAASLLTVCAPVGVKPPHANDISWDPEAGRIRDDVDYRLLSTFSRKCLDAPDDRIHQWDCHTRDWQKWQLEGEGNDIYRVVNRHTRMCLGVDGARTENASKVSVAACQGARHQKVRLEKRGDAYLVKFVHSNKCLDVPKNALNNGDGWHQWDCHNGANQLFKLDTL